MRIDTALAAAANRLQQSSESPRLDAEILLARALDVPKSYLIAHPDDVLDDAAVGRYFAAISRRAEGMPLAYITGEKEFWSMRLMVGPETLVPRPETELLVELALRRLPRNSSLRILDLGTGSGAIALAIAAERPACTITATDISAAALAIAKENARQLEISNVTFLEGDWCGPVTRSTFDLIVSNPPYVRADDPALDALKHEPLVALSSGGDGLDAIRTLARDCGRLLAPAGALLLEHGVDQQAEVAQILRSDGWSAIECCNDLTGRPRVTCAARWRDPDQRLY